MIRVLQMGMTDVRGGTEVCLLGQYAHIDRTRVQYDFLTMTCDADAMVGAAEIRKRGGRVFSLPFPRRRRPLYTYASWLRWMAQHARDYAAITYNMNGLNIAFPLLAFRLFSRGRIVVHSHNGGEMDGKNGRVIRLLRSFNRFLIGRLAEVRLACSREAGAYLFGKRPFTLVRNGIDAAGLSRSGRRCGRAKRRELGLGPQDFVLGHVGRVSYQKQPEFLLEVLAALRRQCPSARLVLAGDDRKDPALTRRLHEQAEAAGFGPAVRFLGPRPDVRDLYMAFDCFLLPSRFEGMPLVSLEAQASGLPCYFSDGVSREAGVTSLAHFLPARGAQDAAHWAQALLSLYREWPARRSHVKEIAAAGYDVRAQAARLMKLYISMEK
jgi:glycosyltransferase involved in cell wall biosynthesis